MSVSNLSITGIGFEVWSWCALCIKRSGDHRALVGLSNHLSNGTSVTCWTLMLVLCGLRAVIWSLWGAPWKDNSQRHIVIWCEGQIETFSPSGWGNVESNRKALCTLCNTVLCVKSEYLNFAKVRETQNKHCAKYSKPLCCCRKGWLTFGGQEDWDLTQEEMSWSHLCFRESASSMQLLLELCVDNCILVKGFSLYRE